MSGKTIIVTNNPLVLKELSASYEIIYKETTYEGILSEIRDLVHKSYRLLTHPLSGSVKPKETPYKSVMMEKGDALDVNSLALIEKAVEACGKFEDRTHGYPQEILEDFRLIDLELIKGACASCVYIN